MLAAAAAVAAIAQGRAGDRLSAYETGYRESTIYRDLRLVRNVKPLWARFGTLPGMGLGGFDLWTNHLFGFSFFGSLGHGKPTAKVCKRPLRQGPSPIPNRTVC